MPFAATLAETPAKDMFELAVDLCPSGIVMVDGAGKMVIVNNEVERLFGYRRSELIGQLIDMLVPEGRRTQHVLRRRAFAARPEARPLGASGDLFGMRKDGSEFSLEIGLNPILVGGDQFVLCAIVDISARKRQEHLKDQFVSTVSHELRTPITSIAGALGLIMGGAAGKLPDAAARLVTVAQANCQRLVRLINDILDIEKLHSGRVKFDLQRVEILPLMQQVMDSMTGFADGYGVRLCLDASPTASTIYVDPDRFAQVMTNLLSNAIKFSPRNAEVVMAIEHRPKSACISVRDRGPGIPAEFKPHVFEEFAQADTTNTRGKGGTGLGLSIAKEIVKRLGGQIGFHDALGGGTVFYVELPSRSFRRRRHEF